MTTRLAQLETDLRAKVSAIEALMKDTHPVDNPDYVATAEQKAALNAALAEGEEIQKKIDGLKGDQALVTRVNKLSGGITATPDRGVIDRRSIGQQFITSAEYRAILTNQLHRRAGSWTSDGFESESNPLLQATTITSDPTSGGALIIPQYVPGVVLLGQPQPVVADLIAPGTATSNVISFMREKTFTNNANTVLEGAAKPESALVFEAATSPVRKIAHSIPVTEEALEDAPQLQSVIDNRLRLGLALKEEQQLLFGDGVAPNLLGFTKLPGLTPDLPKAAGDSNADAIQKQITTIATTSFVMPDGFVMDPASWSNTQRSKNALGGYFGPGPWATPQTPTLWGINGVVTVNMTAGTALLGSFKGAAQLFRRGGVRLEATNSHQDFFIKNLIAIRCEERLALVVYREAAFGTVSALDVA